MTPTALFLLVLFPFLGAAFACLMKAPKVARTWALLVSFCTFVFSLLVAIAAGDGRVTWGMDPGNTIEIAQIGFAVRLACDGVSAWLLLLTTLLMPLVILSVSPKIDARPDARWFYTWLLVLLGSIVGCFVAGDALLFYFFFELTLVPCLLLIGIWGGPDRRRAAGKFFIYTFAGSIFMLIGLLYLGAKAGTFEIGALVAAAQNPTLVSANARFWLALAFLAGFLVKTPVFPLHTWQAPTYAESPNSVTVVLAAIMSKLGTYGLLRLAIPIGFVGLPPGDLIETVVALCLISIVYGGLIAWVQKDMARIMAFSSVSHLGVCVLAILAMNTIGLQGAVVYMLAHGLATAALFFLIGMIADRTGTRDITEMSGLFKSMPIAGTLLVGFTMASIGLPLTSGFVGEFLSLQGVMNAMGLGIAAVASLGIILGAIYMLNMVAKIGFGPERAPEGAVLRDLSGRDLFVLLPIAAAILLLGVMPTPVLDSFKRDVAMLRTPAYSGLPIHSTVGPAQSEEAVFQEPGQ
ncbi:MAG TPA: NADH-quinone oxidoreductase subunit M [Tepidisphaeraceae bacterium]|jgi:NADH-quinone oxidoreductase subunit M